MRPPTPSQTVGPFFGFALPFEGGAEPGGEERIEGRVLDGAGEPVPDAILEIADGDQFARCRTDDEGAFHFVVRRAGAGFFELTVLARGLLRPLFTRVYLPEAAESVPTEVAPERRSTLVARRERGILHHEIRLQGQAETVFFS